MVEIEEPDVTQIKTTAMNIKDETSTDHSHRNRQQTASSAAV